MARLRSRHARPSAGRAVLAGPRRIDRRRIARCSHGADRPGAAPQAVDGNPGRVPRGIRASAERFELGDDGWSYLAAIGKIESDHGRSTAPGVHSGQNSYGCCAGPMQIHNGFGTGGGTWGAYKVDGDGDGREDIYDPADAVATAAQLPAASGAPGDWRARDLRLQPRRLVRRPGLRAGRPTAYSDAAGARRRPATSPRVPAAWLADVPGAPGERCDRRIVPDVVMLIGALRPAADRLLRRRAARSTASTRSAWPRTSCPPTATGTARCASPRRTAGRRPARRAGCGGRGPFRVVLYNGYPGSRRPRPLARRRIFTSPGSTHPPRRSRARAGCASFSPPGALSMTLDPKEDPPWR